VRPRRRKTKRIDPRVAKAILRLKGDFPLFCTLLKIVDKEGHLVTLDPHEAQDVVRALFEGNLWTFILKARRIGCTTIIAAWILWRVMFTAFLRAAVLAHLDESAQEIFEIYHRFYDNLPGWLKEAIPTKTSNVRALEFTHGGRVRVASARSEKLRGGGYQIVHADEVALYRDVKKMMRSSFSAADGAARIIMSTTASGVNEAFHFWNGTGDFQQAKFFKRLFVSWLMDPTAVVQPGSEDWIPPFEEPELQAWEAELRERVPGITEPQMGYARRELIKQGGSFDGFDQENPTSANIAFILSGKPYFRTRYEEAMGKDPVQGLVVHDGRLDRNDDTGEWIPKPWHIYCMGVDTAGGVPGGDFSACYVIDATDPDKPLEVATLYVNMEIAPFCEAALELALKFNAYTCIERNNHGLSVVQRFKHAGYPYLYRTTVAGKVGEDVVKKIGWDTGGASREQLFSDLQEAVNLHRLEPKDVRFKAEINSCVWRKDGKPGHEEGAHDDLVVAAGLAIQARSQCDEVHEVDALYAQRPTNGIERVQWEMASLAAGGGLYEEGTPYGDDDHSSPPSFSTTQVQRPRR
jgi:hypothetical protein